MDILENIHAANSLDERILLQTKAIRDCDKLSTYIELSMNLNRIGSDTACCWQSKIGDVKYMTIRWRDSDEKR